MSLFDELSLLQSRGSQTDKAKNMGGLHAKREEHLSQFFTPKAIVDFGWALVSSAMDDNGYYRILDNSCGAGVWFSNADPQKHQLVGVDIDAELLSRVQPVLDSSGFNIEIEAGDMAAAKLPKCSVAFINPPFSIQLESVSLEAYEGVTHYGKFGPNTSALSHEYALMQALSAADIVCALVPSSLTQRINEIPAAAKRLRAVYSLPASTFRSENVQSVSTDLLIFGRGRTVGDVVRGDYEADAVIEPLDDLSCRNVSELGRMVVSFEGKDVSEPVVITPASNDKRVKMTRHGRYIKLGFRDGGLEAKVLNRLYRKRLVSDKDHRYPQGINFDGQLRLSLDVMMMQDDPKATFNELVADIRSWGGEPVIQPELLGAFKSLANENKIMSVPYGLTVFREGSEGVVGTAKRTALLNRVDVGAAVRKGEVVEAKAADGGFQVVTSRGEFFCEDDAFRGIFDLKESATDAGAWVEVHPPIKSVYPERIAVIEKRMREVPTASSLNWDFQFEDVVEVALKTKGSVIALEMGLGKTRCEITLGLYFHGASLVVVKSRLIDELLIELEGLGVSEDLYKVIRSPSDTRDLRSLNIISYEKLRSAVHRSQPKLTYAKLLKGKIKTLLADEGGLVSKADSAQTKAIHQVNAKRIYLLDGTPASNYPRENLPLLCATGGEGRSYQPFSIDGPYMERRFVNGCEFAEVGRKAFMSKFSVFQWSTNQFVIEEQGAKREVPKVPAENLAEFRGALAPLVKRRTQQEPAVKSCVTFPVPTINPPITVDWDDAHFDVYKRVCNTFSDWYMKYKAKCDLERKKLSLVVILARLEACFKAANVPSTLSGVANPYWDETSKETAVIEHLIQQVKEGKRPIMFARSPDTVDRIHKRLEAEGLDFLVFTGKESIKSRGAALRDRVRGETCVDGMLATLGVVQDGLNLPVFSNVVFYNRSYSFREERQAIFRLLRAANKSEVAVDYFHLDGSIDDYMGQLSDWKATSFASSLDYGVSDSAEDFHHFDSMLAGFLASIEDMNTAIKAAA